MKFSKFTLTQRNALVSLFLIGAVASIAPSQIRSHAQEPRTPKRLLTFTAVIDGSGRFIFDDRGVRYEHKHWSEPTQVVVNDVSWEVLANGFSLKKIGIDSQKLKSAKVVKREGRDVIALEHTENGFDLYTSDSPPGAEPYSVTIEMNAAD